MRKVHSVLNESTSGYDEAMHHARDLPFQLEEQARTKTIEVAQILHESESLTQAIISGETPTPDFPKCEEQTAQSVADHLQDLYSNLVLRMITNFNKARINTAVTVRHFLQPHDFYALI